MSLGHRHAQRAKLIFFYKSLNHLSDTLFLLEKQWVGVGVEHFVTGNDQGGRGWKKSPNNVM
jgi:hypothetical protein